MVDRKPSDSNNGARAGIEKRGGYAAGDRKPIAEWEPPPTGPAPGAVANDNGSDTSSGETSTSEPVTQSGSGKPNEAI